MTPDYPSVFEGYERSREKMRQLLRSTYIRDFKLEPCALLDAGCGEGFWGDLFQHEGFDVTGFDLSEAYIATGREKYPRLPLHVADIDKPLPFGTYDIVFCRGISHYYRDPDLTQATSALRNLRQHVKPDGKLLLAIYTKGDGSIGEGQFGGTMHYHPVAAYRRMVWDAGGEILKQTRQGNLLNILCR